MEALTTILCKWQISRNQCSQLIPNITKENGEKQFLANFQQDNKIKLQKLIRILSTKAESYLQAPQVWNSVGIVVDFIQKRVEK